MGRDKPHKHRWTPHFTDNGEYWIIRPRCSQCGMFGATSEARLSDLLLEAVKVSIRTKNIL